MYLLDTNVISELRRVRPHGAVLAWLGAAADAQLRLSAVTIGEIQRGIEIARANDPRRAGELERWLAEVEQTWSVLPMSGACFRTWARLMHRRSPVLARDAMIAATALVHGLRVATRNVRDFETFDVDLVDPFAA